MAKKKNPKQSKPKKQFVSKAQWKKCAEDLYQMVKLRDSTILERNQRIEKLFEKLEEFKKANKGFLKINKENLKVNKELLKENQEVTRAYMGLHQMGKFASEQGIDIKKYVKKLPEQNKYKDFMFKQEHTVLESGNVRHSYTITPPKKDKDGK